MNNVPWGDISVNAMLILLAAWPVWGIFTGRLVTRREADSIKANCEQWQRAAEQRSAQISLLLSATDISTKVLEALEEEQT